MTRRELKKLAKEPGWQTRHMHRWDGVTQKSAHRERFAAQTSAMIRDKRQKAPQAL